MNGFFLSVIIIGTSASFYPFEFIGALNMMASRRPRVNLMLFLLAYNLPLILISFLAIGLFGKNRLSQASGPHPWLNIALALICVAIAIVVFARRNHPTSNQKHENSLFKRVAKQPVALGAVILVLNPTVLLFIIAGINIVIQAEASLDMKVLAVLVLMIFANITTLVLAAAYSVHPKLARQWVLQGQRFATRHTWELIVGILLIVALISGGRGWMDLVAARSAV